MTFPWLTPSRPGARADARLAAQLRDVRDRAALFYRLGYSAAAAIARIEANIAWEHDSPSARGQHERPSGLSAAAIAAAVQETYARRPSGAF